MKGRFDQNIVSVVVLLLAVFCLGHLASANVFVEMPLKDKIQIAESYERLPIAFEANEGQTDPKVRYFARGQGYTLFMVPEGFVILMTTDESKDNIKMASIRIKFVNRNADVAAITGVDKLPGRSNYFIGNDPRKWRTDVSAYEKVRYDKIYRGVALVVYGNQRQIEYDFVVAPHTDYKQIALRVEGAKTLKADKDGNLIIAANGNKMLMHKPLVYQETDGVKREIKGRYVVGKGNMVSFNVAAYDKDKELVIDPTLVYSTYLGGSASDSGTGIAVDSSGNAYVTGRTASTDFPTTTGTFRTSLKGTYGAFITKLNSTGTALVYSTYLGGSASDSGTGIAVDSSGNAYVAGQTASTDFPTTTGAYQTTLKGSTDAFITKLNATGTALVYSTYLGGSGNDSGTGIAVDSSGNAHVTGQTASTDFPITTGAYQTTLKGSTDAFITKLNATGTALVYSTYLGGSGSDSSAGIAVDSSGNAYVTGTTYSTNFPVTTGAYQTTLKSEFNNAFITKLNATGTALVYSTYLGGTGYDNGYGIAVDSSGNAYVTGTAHSTDFPVTTGAYQTTLKSSYDPFITKLNATGTVLVYSTFLGGSGDGAAIAVDSSGNAYVTGTTYSTNFPTTTGAYQTTLKSLANPFITKLNATGTGLLYSTYLGGSGRKVGYEGGVSCDYGYGIAVDSSGNAYVTGYTDSTDFPVTTGAYQTTKDNSSPNVFITKLPLSSGALDYDLAVAAITTIYNEYPTYFGTKSGSVTTGTSGGGTFYVQWFTNGTAILAWTDGYMYWTEGKAWYLAESGVMWQASSDYTLASTAINQIYSQFASSLGTKSGGVATGIATSGGTYYVQYFTNGGFLIAWTDGYVYYYSGNGGAWASTGVAWKTSSDYTLASTAINQIYSQFASSLGTKSGGVTTGTATSGGTYYVQYFTNGGFLIAWTDNYVYYYSGSGGAWASTGVKWK
ncbi:MAG: SBBP repeat-containing protein [Nitrospirae bacterium]|nr:SBBP repeat-containing protein [Nitrospirota bacterium]